MKHYRIITLGCKVNQCESDSIAARLERDGWHRSSTRGAVELVIVNTCAVTGKAAMQSRQVIRQERRRSPRARMIVTGCYAELEPEAIHETTGEHDIVGHGDKCRIPEMIAGQTQAHPPGNNRQNPPFFADAFTPGHPIPGSSRTRPVLKIQDGCDAFCAYCIVPHARGRSRSMPVGEAIDNIQLLHDAGYHEVVLSGIHLGCYGFDLEPPASLNHLMERIARKTGVYRVRLSSIEPKELTGGIITRVAGSTTFCNHFHIPLQSGDNSTLHRMNRPYTAEFFAGLVRNIRTQIPDAAIGADVLIGFPGETDGAFQRTYDLLASLPITYLHVFPFSPRKGTPAAVMPDQVPDPVKKERARRIRELGNAKRAEFHGSTIGNTLEVLIEEKRDPETGWLKGASSNYITVLVEGSDDLKNHVVSAMAVRRSGDNRLIGQIRGIR